MDKYACSMKKVRGSLQIVQPFFVPLHANYRKAYADRFIVIVPFPVSQVVFSGHKSDIGVRVQPTQKARNDPSFRKQRSLKRKAILPQAESNTPSSGKQCSLKRKAALLQAESSAPSSGKQRSLQEKTQFAIETAPAEALAEVGR